VKYDYVPRCAALGTLAFHTVVAVTHGGPVAVPDVSAYLSIAQWFGGGIALSDLAYHPGYGLLLAPFGTLDGSTLHTVALVLNGIVASLCVLLAAAFARDLGASPKIISLVAAISVVHPALSTSSRIAWPEPILVGLLLVTALLIRRERWIWVGVIVAGSVLLHPRAIVFVIAGLIVSATDKKTFIKFSSGLVPVGLLVLGLLHVTHTWPSARVSAAQNLGEGPGPVSTLVGQWLALGATTGGLAVLGLGFALFNADRSLAGKVHGFISLSAAGMLALGGWVLAGSERADTLLYGRYIGVWAVPLTIVGTVAVFNKRLRRNVSLSVLAVSLCSLAIVVQTSSQVEDNSRTIMTLGMSAIWRLFDNDLVVVCCVSVAVIAIACLASRATLWLPLTVLALVAVSSTVINHRHLNEVGEIADGQAATADLVPHSELCLLHDRSTKSYSMWLYRLKLPEIEHRRVDLATGQNFCGQYVIALPSAVQGCAAAQLVGTEPRASWGLWKLSSNSCN